MRLLERPDRPTALLCFSDAFAAQALRAAEALGLRVPEDLSVVGFDDGPLATSLAPALTTVAQDVTEKGRLAVAGLLQVMAGLGSECSKCFSELKYFGVSASDHVVETTQQITHQITASSKPLDIDWC